MRLPPKQKAVVVVTFAMGIYVTIIGIIRIYYLQEAIPEQRLNISEQEFEVDLAWSASKVYMWSAVEVNIGIICCCIPTLKPLVKKKFSSTIFRNVPDTIPLRPLTHQNIINTRQKITNGLPGIVLPHDESQHHVGMMIPNISPEITLFLSTKDSSNSIQHIEKSQDFCSAKPMCPISILKLNNWESFKYCAIVTVLFFLWGFSYGLLFNLNNTTIFSPELSTSNISLSTAYFSSYLIGALIIGKQVLQFYGFKATFITGLFIYATGALAFWPSMVLASYPGLVISNIIIGTGVSVIETAANPFVVLCGPQSKSEFRLLLAQSVQALAATFSRVFISKIVAHDTISLHDLRWTYIAIMLFNIALSLGISYVPLPEGLDDELEIQTASDSTSTSRPTSTPIASPASALTPDTDPRYRLSHHILISMVSKIYRLIMTWNIIYVIALFFYVSAQETLSLALIDFLSHLPPKVIDKNTPFKFYDLIAYSLFAIGRLVFALLCLVFAPRILLFAALIFCLIIVSISAILPRSSIITGKKENFSCTNLFQGWALIVFFFEGPIFPLMFALGMRRMRGRNKSAAANMIAAVSGGGTFPWMVPMVRNHNTPRNIRVIFGILVVLFTVCTGILIPDIVWWGGKDKEVTQTLDVE
ncbi:hypothetical protein K3495_g873 [Podosphaera aphanis]|nr:hypothetical protein K3495_g873 [Podosphaera aphanis]